jgi:hypothetical protein
MVTDSFGLLLEEVGKLLDIPKLEPDRNNSCLIAFPKGPSIQFEIEKSGNNFLIMCDLGEIPAGPYRENVFREALKYNGRPYPHACQFAYSNQTKKLVMTHLLPLLNLRGEQVINALTPFQAIAKQWQEALARGEVPVSEGAYLGGGAKPFGMK